MSSSVGLAEKACEVNIDIRLRDFFLLHYSNSSLNSPLRFALCSSQTDGVFVESFSPTICNGAPIYRSNLLYADIKKTEGKVREIFSVVGSSTQTRTWYMTERFLALDDEGEAEERSMEMCGAGLTVVESSAFAEQTVVELSDAGQTVVTLLGRGCEGCAEMQSTSSWICEYLESSLTSYNGLAKEVTFQQLDDGPCFHWKAQHPRPFCGESCMSNANKIGWVLFCFYTLVPLFRLWKMGRAVKAVLNKFEGDYEDSFEALALKARTGETEDRLGAVVGLYHFILNTTLTPLSSLRSPQPRRTATLAELTMLRATSFFPDRKSGGAMKTSMTILGSNSPCPRQF